MNLNFYEAVEGYKRLFQGVKRNLDVRVRYANNIIKRFLNPNSMSEVNVSASAIAEVHKRMEFLVNAAEDLFDTPWEEVYQLMANDSFARFVRTETFREYMGISGVEPATSL